MSSKDTGTGTDDTSARESTGATDDSGETDESPVDARIYHVLGEQFLTRPDRKRIDTVGAWAREWLATAESLPLEIETALQRIVDGCESDTETVRTAYTQLLRGVAERLVDPPYESLYVDGQFYSDTTTEIRQGYRWAGVDVGDTGSNEPPDHLGLELQFLGELVAMDDHDTGPEEPDIEDAQWWLLEEHLTQWVPTYMARIQQADPHDYYAGLVELTLAVVKTHRDRLGERR